MTTTTVGIAMSGGVDSTATALLLREHYTVTGFFMQLAQPDLARQQAEAEEIAARIGIPLNVVDLSAVFAERVLGYFSRSYEEGATPNPCIVCNQAIKFGLFQEAILGAGMDKMATGHYARSVERDGLFHLLKGVDAGKDQSYFLSRLEQHQLAAVLLPLGDKLKEETYQFVERHGFHSFRGRESQDVCFLEDGDLAAFLSARCTSEPGPIIDCQGRLLGRHRGIVHYTVGQRRGLGIAAEAPYYVLRLDAAANTVIVGRQEELLRREVEVRDLHWPAPGSFPASGRYSVKIRSTHSGSDAHLRELSKDRSLFHFSEPQRGVTPGQFAVAYAGDEVVCCGEIV